MPKNLTQKQIVILAAVGLGVIILLVVFIFSLRSKSTGQGAAMLTVWGTDSSKAFEDMISAYAGPGSGTQAQIKYVQIDPADYHNELLSALAAGTGPDVFEIGNRDLAQWQNLLAPLPATLATTFNEVTLQNDFPTVVDQDFVSGGQVYALPLSIDTIGMIYNKDLLDSAGIALPPKTWTDFDSDVPLLRVQNAQGQLTQAATALGGSNKSIANAADLVFLLMLQNGTQMTNPANNFASFVGDGTSNAGQSAFNFYLQFANPASSVYTWNDGMGTAVNSFTQGKTAIIFDYSSAIAAIKAKSPFLNIGIAPMPQPADATVAVNYARYNGLAVSHNTTQAAAAWNFVISLTTTPASEKIYTDDTGAPPALRTSIQTAMTDPATAVFASQALSARSWHESNSDKIDGIMNNAINNVLVGAADSTAALVESQTEINTIRS